MLPMLYLHFQGIYRVSGVKSKVEALCQTFESQIQEVDLSDQNPHVISNVLKLYLRQVSQFILEFSFKKFLLTAVSSKVTNSLLVCRFHTYQVSQFILLFFKRKF